MNNVQIQSGQYLSYLSLGDNSRLRPVIFLHGIMGNKKNLRSFAQRFVEENPSCYAIIFDLPNHGESCKLDFAPSIFECAEMVRSAVAELNIEPFAWVGHSFGAKVALLCASQTPASKSVFMLDASPRAYGVESSDNSGSFSTVKLIDCLINLPMTIASRQQLVDDLMRCGAPQIVALWMTTNLVDTKDGYRLLFDANLIKQMLISFLNEDLWPIVSQVGQYAEVHLVAAEHGGRLNLFDQKQISLLPKGHGFFHVLKNAGHFLHTDNPAGLLNIMKPYF